jgi:pimeloyl-ACP methyl ester carboxylesterase
VAISTSEPATERGRAAGVAYERAGSGPPLLLIHGLGGTRGIWRPQLPYLVAERQVIAVDMPGFGESPPVPGRAAPWGMATAIAELCAELGIERPHVAGNSLGAWVAIEMAKREEAESLCLISPAGLWRRPLGPRRFDTQRWARRLRPLILAALRSPGARERLLRGTVGHPERLSAADAREVVRAWVDAPGYEAANDEMRAHICEGLDQVRVPTTIAWGELDRLVTPPRPERRPPGSEFLVLPGCGHTPNWDEPELIAKLLLNASVPATPY